MEEDSALRLSSNDATPKSSIKAPKSLPNKIMIIDDDCYLQIIHQDYCVNIPGVTENLISCFNNGEEALEALE